MSKKTAGTRQDEAPIGDAGTLPEGSDTAPATTTTAPTSDDEVAATDADDGTELEQPTRGGSFVRQPDGTLADATQEN
ncbi:MAG: hypothetical protein V4659_09475 [Pseudomonadota bacterium]